MMPGFGNALNRIVRGREESAEEVENAEIKRARSTSQDEIVHDDKTQNVATKDFTELRRILVIRGFVVYSFDPQTGEWERCSDARRDRAYFETVLLNGFVYAVGSMNVTDAGTVEKFVISENKWENVVSLPTKIRSLAAAAIETKDGRTSICVCGGIDLDSMVSSAEVYLSEPSTEDAGELVGAWKVQQHKMLTPRYRHASVVFEGSLWVMGGIVNGDDGQEYTSTTEIMNCATGEWSTGPTMVARRAIDVAPVIVGGILYIVGGDVGKEVGSGSCWIIGTIEVYDPASKQFKHVSTFPRQRKGFSSAAVPGDKNIYCFGGREGNQDLTTWDAFNVATGQWHSLGEPNAVFGDMKMPFMDSLYGRAISLLA